MSEPTEAAAGDDAPVEVWGPPAYGLGDKVVAIRDVRNDGTFPGARMGDVLIRAGAVGYVHSVGTYLNRFYVFGIDFVDAGRLVGMRTREIELVEQAPQSPSYVPYSTPRNPS
jgi:nitrogen fixation protein NifZ